MKVLIIVDKVGTAIYRMSLGLQKYNPHWNIDIIAVHPKRPEPEDLDNFKKLADEADVLDFEYYKSALMLLDKYPELKSKKKILTHHNPYSLGENDWLDFDKVVVLNEYQKKILPNSILIPHTIDLDNFEFNRNYTDKKVVGMVAARIEGKKGILPVAKACKYLGYKMLLVGRVSDINYFNEIIATGVVEPRLNITDQELKEVYKEMAVLVCNSVDGFESGTLPILEAMISGVPVLTRQIGYIPEFHTADNMAIINGQPDDLEGLKKDLNSLMEDKPRRLKIREAGWKSARIRSDVRRARAYSGLYYNLISGAPLVSVVVPTFNRKETLVEVIGSIEKQDYPSIEIVIADDGSTDRTEILAEQLRYKCKRPIKYVNTGDTDKYHLAKARNMGAIEAEGKYLLFLDDRYVLEPNAVSEFMQRVHEKSFMYGDKSTGKNNFVENFALIKREDFFTAGMFCERLEQYGGLTQETSNRFNRQGCAFIFTGSAKAHEVRSSHARNKKEEIQKSKDMLFKMGM